jgi:Tol biopolymer transport system component
MMTKLNRFGLSLFLISLLSLSIMTTAQNFLPYFANPVWSPNGNKIAIVLGSLIEIRDTQTNQVIHSFEGHTAPISMIAWSPNGTHLVSSSSDQTVKIWNTIDGTLLHSLSGHDEPVTAVAWSSDGNQVISSGIENRLSLFVWDAQKGERISQHIAGTIVDMAFSPDGKYLAYTTSLSVHVVDSVTFEAVATSRRVLCCENVMYSLAWSPDGSRLVTGNVRGLVTIWNANTAEIESQFIVNNYHKPDGFAEALSLSWVRDVVFNPDGKTIFSASGDGTLQEWDITTKQLVASAQIEPFKTAAWSPFAGRLGVLETDAYRGAEILNYELDIEVPLASSERLRTFTNICISGDVVQESVIQQIEEAKFTDIIPEIEKLDTEQISPACAADLIAVAEALLAEE